MTQMKHLSIVDGAFLHMESAEMPMHVGSLNLFEPPAGYSGEGFYEEVKAHVAKRMHLAAVFTRKLALMPFDLANPVWIHDDDIDLDYHVRYMVLPKPGTIEQLEALAARLHSMLLDRSRPLWEFYVIEGLADGRIGFYGKVHHAAVDGQAGVAMATSLFDITPEPRAVKPPREARANTYQLGVAELLAAALQNQIRQVVESLKLVPALANTAPARRRRRSRSGARKAPRTAPRARPRRRRARFKLAPATPFNHSITNQRAFAAVSLPLPEIKAIGKGVGASINDIVLWLCSTALRSYLKEGRELPEKSLVAGVPISLRQEGDTTSNNQVAGTLIDLGTEIADPAERLKAIKRGTAAMKKQMGTFRGVIPTDFPSLGSPWLISGLASLYGRSRIADWLRLANVTISNVPGSRVPVYLCGAKMTDYYPLSIVVHGVALNITVQSHVDKICFGLIACRRAVPDVHELGSQLERAMATLRELVARRPRSGRRRRRRPRSAGRAAAPARAAAPRARQGGAARAPRQPRLRVVAPAACVGAAPAAASACGEAAQGAAGARRAERAMRLVADVFVALVALLHVWFLVLEMFLWDKPLGLKTFRQTPRSRGVEGARRQPGPLQRLSRRRAAWGLSLGARARASRCSSSAASSSPASTAPRPSAGRSCSCRRCRRRSRSRWSASPTDAPQSGAAPLSCERISSPRAAHGCGAGSGDGPGRALRSTATGPRSAPRPSSADSTSAEAANAATASTRGRGRRRR